MHTSLGVVMRIVIELSCWPDTKSRVFQQPASGRRGNHQTRAEPRNCSSSRASATACRRPEARPMNPHLDFLLSVLYDSDPLAPEHLADLRKSGLSDTTIGVQKLRSVPPSMI